MQNIFIGNNKIGDNSVDALVELIKNNYTLQLIDISNNNINSDGVDKICKSLQYNYGLHDIYGINTRNIISERDECLHKKFLTNKSARN